MWQEVQNLIEQRKAVRVRAGTGHPILRYSGLLRCSDCGRTFVGKRIKLKSGERVEYICDTYLRYGKEHYYAKDIGKKIRAGYRQKQKEGLVVIPPFGYWKDKNTIEILMIPEAADTVRRIFQLFLDGMTLMPISRILNQETRKTPAQFQMELYGKKKPDIRQFLWSYTSVKNVLQDESYVGVLYNHQDEVRDGKRFRKVPEEEWFRHENVYPPIISREDWEQAQALLQKQRRKRAKSNAPCHRYAGLLSCSNCGAPLVAINRYWNGTCRVEYICKTYMRHGKDTCTSHRIREEKLDTMVWELVSASRESRAEEQNKLAQMQKMWALRKPILDAHILLLQKRIQKLEQEIDGIVMEHIQALSNINLKANGI